jgi:hypothetical protein
MDIHHTNNVGSSEHCQNYPTISGIVKRLVDRDEKTPEEKQYTTYESACY